AGGEVHGQRAVPDLRGLGAADAGDLGAVAGRRVVAHAAESLGRAAFRQQVEEAVGDAGGIVHVQGAEVAGVAAGRTAVPDRVEHVAQGALVGAAGHVADHDFLADQVVRRVLRVVG